MKPLLILFMSFCALIIQAQPIVTISSKSSKIKYLKDTVGIIKVPVEIKINYNGTGGKTPYKVKFTTFGSSNVDLVANDQILDSLEISASEFTNAVKEKKMTLLIDVKAIDTLESSELFYIGIVNDSPQNPMHRVTIESVPIGVNNNSDNGDNDQTSIDKQKALIAKQEDSLEIIAKIVMRKEVDIRLDILKEKLIRKDSVIREHGFLRKKVVATNDTLVKYYDRTVLLSKIKINQVNISVREGVITEILVQTDSGTFRNRDAIIDILHIDARGSDRLKYVATTYRPNGKWRYIYLDDVIDYIPFRSFKNLPYSDFDVLLVPTDNIYYIKESTSINTYFDIAAFTDIKGISGEPNGIAQFTADAKFITNTRNIRSTSIIPFHFVAFSGGLSKFDNDFKGTNVYNHDSISRKDLLQRSLYKVGVKINLYRSFSPPDPKIFLFDDFQLNAGFNFLGSRILDTVIKASVVVDTTYRTVTQNQFYIEPRLVLSRHKNFSMSLTLPFYFMNIKKSAGLKNDGMEYWAMPGISLMYFGKRDSKSRLFFRYNHWINLKDKTQAFTQMQLGYSVNLTDVWGSSK